MEEPGGTPSTYGNNRRESFGVRKWSVVNGVKPYYSKYDATKPTIDRNGDLSFRVLDRQKSKVTQGST